MPADTGPGVTSNSVRVALATPPRPSATVRRTVYVPGSRRLRDLLAAATLGDGVAAELPAVGQRVAVGIAEAAASKRTAPPAAMLSGALKAATGSALPAAGSSSRRYRRRKRSAGPARRGRRGYGAGRDDGAGEGRHGMSPRSDRVSQRNPPSSLRGPAMSAMAQQLERRREHGAHAVLAAQLGLPGLVGAGRPHEQREGERFDRVRESMADTLVIAPLQTRPKRRPPAPEGDLRWSSRRWRVAIRRSRQEFSPERSTSAHDAERRSPARGDGATGWRAAGSPARVRADARRPPGRHRAGRHRPARRAAPVR